MTKQEEIREGVMVNILKACPDMLNKDIMKLADKILKDEDSQGVVIKVDTELPILHWCEMCVSYETGTDPIDGEWSACNNEKCDAKSRKWKLRDGYVTTKRLI